MRYSILIPLLSLMPLTSSCQSDDAPSPARAEWRLVWQDEFDESGAPDSTRWGYDVGGHGWGNKELQFYTEDRRENARVEDGHLIIEAHREPWEGMNYTSARLVSKGRGDWTYGRFEIKARVPRGRGTWPAIWMLPTVWDLGDGKWPDNGEIDIMEHVGHDHGVVHASLHTRDHQWPKNTQLTGRTAVPTVSDQFHVYALEWEEDEIRMYVDNHHFFTARREGAGWTTWPFFKDFHFVLNIAIGGLWGGAEGVDDSIFPQRLEIDYIRVYQRDEPTAE